MGLLMLAKGITIRLRWVKLEHEPVLPESTYYTANIIIIIIIIIVVNWDSPDLTQFLFSFLLFFLNNPISGSICKLPIRSKIYNCTFKNTNKVSIIIIIMIMIIIMIIIIIITVV